MLFYDTEMHQTDADRMANTVDPSDGDKDVYCICTHGLLIDTHGNFKPSVYRVH